MASGARGTGRGGVSTRRGACAVPGGGKDEKLFAKDIVALSQLRLLEMLSMDRESSRKIVLCQLMATGRFCVGSAESSKIYDYCAFGTAQFVVCNSFYTV